MQSIQISNDTDFKINEVRVLQTTIFAMGYMGLDIDTEVSISFVSETEMHSLNLEYMNEDAPTDVLAFPMDELRPLNPGEESQAGILGDLVFSPDYILQQSQNQNVLFEDELDLLVVHGVLHCLGFDHQEEIEHKEMFDLQREILEALAEYRQGGPIE
ncbi:MAG: rRNA maturation RNase YbeY [Candidatus Nanopelagicales bacterium]